jgi:hypothetical protein
VLIDDMGCDLKRHPSIGVLLRVLPERGPSDVEILGRGDGVDKHDPGRVPLSTVKVSSLSRRAS